MKTYRIYLFAIWIISTGIVSFGAFTYRDDIKQQYTHTYTQAFQAVKNIETPHWLVKADTIMAELMDTTKAYASHSKDRIINFLLEKTAEFLDVPEKRPESLHARNSRTGYINASYNIATPLPSLTLSEIKKRKEDGGIILSQIAPASGLGEPVWIPDQPTLDVEAVLVPRRVAVISSSQDGRIASIPVNHGDRFKKGDVLLAYDCSGIRAEADIAKVEKNFTQKRFEGTDKLFKLDIISDIDRASARVENERATIKGQLYESRLQDCDIKAEFDGRVTNRLANPGEYTRTDRVLLEVASEEPLRAEFLIPSKWLRWVNINAPVSLTINETERTYSAKITRIHGEVDPVSQSIQIIATLDPYNDLLMPGMSGKVIININDIRKAGIPGYLEVNISPAAQ